MKESLTWHSLLGKEKYQPYFLDILRNIANERISGITIYPAQKDIFNVLRFTELKDIKVVIIGQDPYSGRGQAHGLAFSVCPGISIPPSLINIYKELEETIPDFNRPNHGYLKSWALQGVFLLNTVLTVRAGQSYSHANIGWEIFTNKVISIIDKYCENVIFLLWGIFAQKKEKLINKQRHYVLMAPHPSPLSAYRGFSGCNHFNITNKLLKKHGKSPIDWTPKLYI